MDNPKILIVDDDDDIIDLLTYNFIREGFLVKSATNGEECIEKAISFRPDLIILDIMMPNMDGVETCRILRSNSLFKNTFIVFLTARTEEYSELAGFGVGADDYITKPVKPRVIISRVQAILKRGDRDKKDENDSIIAGGLEIIKGEYIIKTGNQTVHLPRKEFELLSLLAANPNKVFRREDILDLVWGDVVVVDRTVDVHIRKIREKIGEGYIQTIKGVGYKFVT